MAQHNLDALDKKILRLIADDARMPFLEVARICNVSGAAIHQRIQKLTNLGVIKGSQFIIDPEKIGYETCAYIGLFLKDPGQFDFVLEELKKIPEVVECHYTTGGFDMFIKIYALNNHHLLNIIHHAYQHHRRRGRKPRHRLQEPTALLVARRLEAFQATHHRTYYHHGKEDVRVASQRSTTQTAEHRAEPFGEGIRGL